MNAEKKAKVAVVVVHGVGYHEPGASADAVSELLLGLRAREDGSTYAPFTAETIHIPLKPLEIRQPLRGGLVQAKPRFLSFLQERTVYLTTAWRERKAPERLQAEGKEKSTEVANDFMRLLLEDYRGAGEKNSPKSADDSTAYQTTCLVGGRRAGADAGGTTRPSGKPSEAEATAASPGGEHVITNTCSQNYKFEGKERDTESGNDDFGARYYSSRLGRWLSADWSSVPVPVPYANLSNPQTLNLYAMVSDNPETFADLDGHQCIMSAPYGEITCDTTTGTMPSPVGGDKKDPPQITSTTQQAQYDIYKLNGVVTVETSVTMTTTDSKGNKVVTVTNTQAFFSAKKGNEGAFLGAHQTTFTGNIFNRAQRNLTEAQATGVLGSKAIAAATEATAPGFGGELSRDIRAHPYIYAGHLIGLAAGPVLGLGEPVEGLITAIHALHTAFELKKRK